jgi:hypothetical protein
VVDAELGTSQKQRRKGDDQVVKALHFYHPVKKIAAPKGGPHIDNCCSFLWFQS